MSVIYTRQIAKGSDYFCYLWVGIMYFWRKSFPVGGTIEQTVLISLASVEGQTTGVELPAGDLLWSRASLWGGIDGPGQRWSEPVPRLAAGSQSCSSQTWGWPGAWQSDWKLRFLFSYATKGCTCLLQSKHSFDLVNTKVNMKYTSFVSTKWTESSMFDHTFLIIVSKPDNSMVRATTTYSDACLHKTSCRY